MNPLYHLKDAAACMNWLQEQVGKGIDIKRLTTDLIDLLKEALIYEYTKSDVPGYGRIVFPSVGDHCLSLRRRIILHHL